MEATSYGTLTYLDIWKRFYNTMKEGNDFDASTNGTDYFTYYFSFLPWFVSRPTGKLQYYLTINNITLGYFLENFTTYIKSMETKDNGNKTKITFEINNTDIVYDYGDIPEFKTFSYLYNEYADCHAAFDFIGFLNHFENDLQTFYKEFEATNKEIDRLMGLTDEQIAIEYSHIMNIAQIPENTYDTDSESVNFVTQQQKDLNKKGTLQIVREQLVNKKAYTVRQFIARFKHLFIKVLSPTYIPVYEGEEED